MAKECLISHRPRPHEHPEAPDSQLRPKALKRLRITFFIGFGLFLTEFLGAWWSGSLALLADSYHVLGDLGAVTVTLLASYLAERLKSKSRSYGYYRLEVLAALFNGLLLIVLAATIVLSAYNRLTHGHEIQSMAMFVISLLGLAVNLVMIKVLHGAHNHNLNIRSAYFHLLGDALSSVIVTLSAVLVITTELTWFDAAAGLVVAIILSIMSLRLVSEAVHVLLEGTPKHMDPEAVEARLKEAFPQIVNIHDFHIWEITSHLFAMTAHIEATVETLQETHDLIDGLNVFIHDKYGIGHTTFQVEPRAKIDAS